MYAFLCLCYVNFLLTLSNRRYIPGRTTSLKHLRIQQHPRALSRRSLDFNAIPHSTEMGQHPRSHTSSLTKPLLLRLRSSQPHRPPPPLPVEITDMILAHHTDDADKRILMKCTRVSKTFRFIATRHLLKRVSLTDITSPGELAFYRKPEHASEVKHLTIGARDMMWEGLYETVVALVNVECMEVTRVPYYTAVSAFFPAQKRTLRKLTLTHVRFVALDDLSNFVQSFPMLSELEILDCHWPALFAGEGGEEDVGSWQLDKLNRLQIRSRYPRAVDAFVRGLVGGPSSPPLETLDIDTPFTTPDDPHFRLISRCSATLRSLTICQSPDTEDEDGYDETQPEEEDKQTLPFVTLDALLADGSFAALDTVSMIVAPGELGDPAPEDCVRRQMPKLLGGGGVHLEVEVRETRRMPGFLIHLLGLDHRGPFLLGTERMPLVPVGGRHNLLGL